LNLRLFLVRLITLSNLNRFTRSDHRWNRIIEYYILTYNRLQKDRLQPVVDRFFDFSREDATCNWSVAEARQLATAVRSFSVRLRSGCGLFAVLQLDFETLMILEANYARVLQDAIFFTFLISVPVCERIGKIIKIGKTTLSISVWARS
jgi:hypothetical protein